MITQADAAQLANKLAEATQETTKDFAEEDVGGEEDFSSQLCGRLKQTLQGYDSGNMIWQVETAKASKGRGRLRARALSKRIEEPLLGADLVMTIEAEGADFDVKKGFLAQAKRLEIGKYLSTSAHNDLREQCDTMLSITSASYVFLYSSSRVTVLSANAVLSALKRDLWSLPTWPIGTLFYDFVICWIGDRRLQTTSRRTLEVLRSTVDANAAIRILGKPKLSRVPPQTRWPEQGNGFKEH